MGGLRTNLAALLCAAGSIGPVWAGDDLLRTFAGCAGRLSAQMEHEWLMSDAAAAQTEQRRAAMISLMEAMMPKGRGRDVLNWRIEAKMAQATLLTRSTFNDDEDDAAWAQRRAETMIATCNGLVLS